MAQTKFDDIDVDPATAPAEAPKTTALAPTQGTEIAVPRDDAFFKNDGFEGEYDKNSLTIPRITLVHAVGDLSEKFEAGAIVLNGEKTLKTPLEIIPLKIKSFVQEYIAYNDEDRKGDIPKRWENEAEARAAGFIAPWEREDKEDKSPTFEPAASIDLLVKGYPEIADLCPLTFDGSEDCFMPVRLFVKGKQHGLIVKRLFTQSQFNKGAHPATFRWTLTPKRGKEGSNWCWRMHIDLRGRNTPEQVAQYRSITG